MTITTARTLKEAAGQVAAPTFTLVKVRNGKNLHLQARITNPTPLLVEVCKRLEFALTPDGKWQKDIYNDVDLGLVRTMVGPSFGR